MAMRSTYLVVLLMALLASTTSSVRADPQETLTYTTKRDDAMSDLAVRYYSTPDAAQALYDHNERVFSEAYDRNKLSKPDYDTKKNPKGKNTIFPNTTITMPRELKSSKGVIYPRRHEPMDATEAREIAAKKDGIRLTDAKKPLLSLKPAWTEPPKPPALQGSRQQVSKSAEAAKRESTPSWYTEPTSKWQECARDLCDKYQSLCFYECVAVAKRFTDAWATCSKSTLPDKLPYAVKDEGRKDCSAALQ